MNEPMGVVGGDTSDPTGVRRLGEGEGGVPGAGRNGDRGGRGGRVDVGAGREGGDGAALGVSKALAKQWSNTLIEAQDERGVYGGVLGRGPGAVKEVRLAAAEGRNAAGRGGDHGGERGTSRTVIKEEGSA